LFHQLLEVEPGKHSKFHNECPYQVAKASVLLS